MSASELTCQELVELVTDYLEGSLSPTGCRRVEEHLADCDYCVTYIGQMRVTVRLLEALESAAIPAASRERLRAVFRRWRYAPGEIAEIG
jgi:anti-sigma factor RsiW